MRLFLFLFLFLTFSFAAEYDLKTLRIKENSLAKDYYIHRLLEEKKINKKEAQNLANHIFRYVGKIKTEFEKLVPVQTYIDPAYAPCFNYNKKTILDANLTCKNYRSNSLYFISSLDKTTRTKLAKELKQNYPNSAFKLEAFNQDNPLAYSAQKLNSSAFLQFYDYFKNNDLVLSDKFINELAKHGSFKTFAQNIIIKKKNPKIRASLVNINPQIVKEDTAFYLGVNALLHDEEKQAFAFFQQAYLSFKMSYTKDNALFWMYLISKNEQYLETLAQSNSLNIYALYAKELRNKPFPEIIVLTADDKKSNFDLLDPFLWQNLNKQIQNADEAELLKLAKQFNSQHTLAIYAYIMERVSKFKKNYFIMPYYEYLKDYPVQRQALIMAIARQESRFIPTAISTSYALGVMQFMPFLANHIGQKELKIPNFDQDEVFKPEVAYYFANHHLNYLETYLNSPVFVAYAYNGGIGFTRRMLERPDMFKEGKYEPFLSMELVPYQESRIYAKKVLANYIVYQALLNDNIKISSIFENLIQNKANLANKL
ncbi:lytic transglycosylase domain-containing protein [Campylobacter sp. US33a]|uniref:lytic transglycosylase domain-containing protein n=1 Tax=Campylobacter sp. US33a TaxID=2498120 RepID=UPI0010689E84|nr:lytic transglycosylase domain-containing protein [Campylobacter sp. US33a]TEY03472.1 lytic transglycosylase domain-containing protein [Campylobacter sp. US33a]